MTLLIFSLTIRQLFFRKSTFLLLGLGLLPVLIAVIYNLGSSDVPADRWTARNLYQLLLLPTVLPLTALLLGTSALGDEFEDGTAVYLLTKPIPRWQIVMPKLVAAWLITSMFVALSVVISGGVAGADGSLVASFAIAAIVGSLAYCSVFVLLSVTTSRALIAGLVYVFLWEGAITSIFVGARYLSIRHYTMGLAGDLAAVDPFVFNPTVGGTTAIIMFAVVILGATFLANRRLERTEVREPG